MLVTWNDGETKSAIVDFVQRVTTEGGPDYVEPSLRVAVFDNDGTLWCEKPAYIQLDFLVRRLAEQAADTSLGTAISPGAPNRDTAAPPPSAASPPTATACSTWQATSGSGPATGLPTPAPAVRAVRRAATTLGSRSSRCRARSSRADRSSVPIATATATR